MDKYIINNAAGGIGQPLSLLLKSHPQVTELNLYDIVNSPGVAADLSHICTKAKVTGYKGQENLDAALAGCDIVVIPAGIPRKPGMTRDDLFNINAGIVKGLAEGIAKNCPKAFTCIISNPVNSTVPICAEVFKKAGTYDPKRLFGVTLLDIVRSSTFVSECKGTNPQETKVTVIGGHSGVTIVPLLSQVKGLTFTQEEVEALTHRIQFGGDEVVKAKDGAGSATLSMAYAAARFVDSLIEGAFLKKPVVECAYVESPLAVDDGCAFFASAIELGPSGAEKILPIGPLSDFEQGLYKACVEQLKANIAKGVNFVNQA
ncbi:malate dehydrogenase [Neocallimastix californiae]|uniref:malate dehydrogenase n=1 Tax=Neocallimastix californiae TaxID=1754190 RepID=A0A1Y1ZL00_9FUNG|nr:malate dehydrogenase [Neocallimastix californiae]|eukprot:ORY10920.1 malate dehydrogenase [Neocallimastix californiae]